MANLLRLAGVLLVLAVPTAIVLTNIRMMVFDGGLYQRGYERYRVSQSTGMTRAQLAEATAQIQSYFLGGPPVALAIEKSWGVENLFNAREEQHLADVRTLMDLAWRAQEVALGVLFAMSLAIVVARKRAGIRKIGTLLITGGALTLSIFVLLGALSLFDFNTLWTRFHLLVFTNELWLLDPRTDYMIRLYPPGFWFDAVIELALRSVLVATGAVGLGLLARWVSDRDTRTADSESGAESVVERPSVL